MEQKKCFLALFIEPGPSKGHSSGSPDGHAPHCEQQDRAAHYPQNICQVLWARRWWMGLTRACTLPANTIIWGSPTASFLQYVPRPSSSPFALSLPGPTMLSLHHKHTEKGEGHTNLSLGNSHWGLLCGADMRHNLARQKIQPNIAISFSYFSWHVMNVS